MNNITTKKENKNPLYEGFQDPDQERVRQIFQRMQDWQTVDKKSRCSFFAYRLPCEYSEKRNYDEQDLLFKHCLLWRTIRIRVTDEWGHPSSDWQNNLSNIKYIEDLAANHIDYLKSFDFHTDKEVYEVMKDYYRKRNINYEDIVGPYQSR